MNKIAFFVGYKFMLSVFITITFNSCEVSEPVLNPDYTGQPGQITDIEGNTYKTIGIGSQIWMTENLKTTRFNDNSPISNILNDSIWGHLRSPGYCWYNNDSINNQSLYGALYNFYAIETGLICPTGWHVPNESEWNTLESFLGGHKMAGGKLKDYFSPYWNEPNPCFVNSYSFHALPGGERLNISGRYSGIGNSGNWWSSTIENNFQAISRSMSYGSTELYWYASNMKRGNSIRCIKD